jgi:hypothetical protein
MKKLAFTTAIALALSTAAYAAGPQHGGVGGTSGFSGGAPGGAASGFKGGPSGPTGFSGTAGQSRGPMGGVYNQGNIQSYKQGGPYQQGGSYKQGGPGYGHAGRDYDFDHGRHLMNRADRDHDFDRDHPGVEGGRDFDHHGVVRGNFFEHGRHFGFRRFWHGEWVFLNDWDDCTAYAWVHVGPGTWAWAPVDICVG